MVVDAGAEDCFEDVTLLCSDSNVNVANSRMSTYHSKKVLSRANTSVGKASHDVKWSVRMDMLLLQAYDQFPDNWQAIAKALGDKKQPAECRERHEVLKALMVKGRFTQEEDAILREAMKKYGKNWALISKK